MYGYRGLPSTGATNAGGAGWLWPAPGSLKGVLLDWGVVSTSGSRVITGAFVLTCVLGLPEDDFLPDRATHITRTSQDQHAGPNPEDNEVALPFLSPLLGAPRSPAMGVYQYCPSVNKFLAASSVYPIS